MNQADLFKVSESRFKAPEPEDVPFLDRYQVVLRIDHTVIMCIFLLVLLTVVYAYGFERGRNSVVGINAMTSAKHTEKQIVSHKNKKELVIVNTADVVSSEESKPSDEQLLSSGEQEEVLKQEAPLVAIAQKEEEAAKAGQELMEKMTGKYTIQIVTYKSEKTAKERINELSVKGYKGFVIPSGAYHQVCVNTFQDRQEAKDVLKSLQSKKLAPIDAYIRAMPA